MVDSRGLEAVKTVILVVLVLSVGVIGIAAFLLWSGKGPLTDTIRIGICEDLDNESGEDIWQAAVLAAEQVNAEGGILGRAVEIVGEDDDSATPQTDEAMTVNALTRLITVDKADYVITSQSIVITAFQDICSQHKRVLFSTRSALVELTQRVLDDYDNYKYFFRVMNPNVTMLVNVYADSVLTLREYTGFNKIALLVHDAGALKDMGEELVDFLLENDFEIVSNILIPLATFEFSSYLARMEESGAEILFPFLAVAERGVTKEWCERQSPFVIWGVFGHAGDHNFYESTDGRGEFVSCNSWPVVVGYPLTSRTVSAAESYLERWGENMASSQVAATYDIVRFILPDAIKRAGTTEVEAVIKALENTDIETSLARHFRFTSSHDVMANVPSSNMQSQDYVVQCMFQWQNGTQVPVYPKTMMQEVGATYKYPLWSGPWD
jgi:branched-chain amino acid transport system substrate-binding protein